MSRYALRRGSPAKVLGFVALCLIAAMGFASAAYADAASLPATITGYVRTPSGVGIPNVLVRVSGDTSVTTFGGYAGFEQTAVTASNGRFVITDIVHGTYSMYVNEPNASAYATGYAQVNPWGLDELYYPPNFDTRRLVAGGTTEDAGIIKLQQNRTVRGRAWAAGTPVPGSQVEADITTAGVVYTRWATTGADGRFQIADAMPGEWLLHYQGVDQYVPTDAVPSGGYASDYDPITQSEPEAFIVGDGDVNLGDHDFIVGQRIDAGCFEEYSGMSYNISGVGVRMYPAGDPDDWEHTYSWQLGDNGLGHAYMPPGTWDLVYSDYSECYDESTIPAITTGIGGSYNAIRTLTPAAGTYALHGHVSEVGGVPNLETWVTASKVDPGSPWLEYFRRVPSLGATYGDYLIRLPKVTGYTGNKMKVVFSDKASPPDEPYKHVAKEYTITPPAGASKTQNVPMSIGGRIAGTIHDSDGNLVEGVTVWATRKAFDPSFGGIAWTGSDMWWTRTDSNGEYEIGGLPAEADYKVNVYPDYNPPPYGTLDIKYKDYNRRTYKGQPLVDSLNTLVSAPVSDHTPVTVTLDHTTASIDETIHPGGYVALHADGPEQPTGAVWCDVMYQYKSNWFEIDSGYTTGGTFQKISKVLPTGHYKLIYTDWFGRGSGTWEFDLAENEHKYASVVVPAPVSFISGPSLFKGSFAGLIGGGTGLPGGGSGGTMLELATGTVPPAAPPLPKYTIALPGEVLDVKSTGTPVDGKWTLTLPYDPSVPDGEVPAINVIHYKHDGTTEILLPLAWDLVNHTVQVQTDSLSPFRMAYKKHSVKLGTPSASSTWKRYKKYTMSGTISPTHVTGATTAKLKVYRKNSKGHYVLYKTISAPNYKSGTRYRASFSLKAGKYRMRATVLKSAWHLSTTYSKYKYVTVK